MGFELHHKYWFNWTVSVAVSDYLSGWANPTAEPSSFIPGMEQALSLKIGRISLYFTDVNTEAQGVSVLQFQKKLQILGGLIIMNCDKL